MFRVPRRAERRAAAEPGSDSGKIIAWLSSIDPEYWKPSYWGPNTAHAVAGKHLQFLKKVLSVSLK